MEETYSQKTARVFEIISYIALFPAGFGTFMATLFITTAPWFTLLIYGIFGIGFTMLIGYRKHSRGALDEKYVPALWFSTAVYNFLLLLPWLFVAAKGLQSPRGFANNDNLVGFFITAFAVFSYIMAIVASLKAFSIERRKNHLL